MKKLPNVGKFFRADSRLGKIFFFTLFFSFMSLFIAAPASAVEMRTVDTTVAETETISDNLYIFGDEIEIAGRVTGDVIANGSKVTISGTVDGDVYISAGEISVTGTINRGLFMSGGTMFVSGDVGRGVWAAGMLVTIGDEAVIQEDVIAAGMTIDVDGYVGEDVRIAGMDLGVTGTVGGDVDVSGSIVNIDESNVTGDIRTAEDLKELSGESSMATTSAEVDVDAGVPFVSQMGTGMFILKLVIGLLWFIGMYAVGALFIKICPVKTVKIVGKISGSWTEFLYSGIVGFVAVTAGVVLALIVVFTVVGTPFALLFLGLIAFLYMFGCVWSDMAVGRELLKVFDRTDNKYYLSLFVGRSLRLVLKLIPFVGWLLSGLYGSVMFCAVVGAFLRMKWELMTGSASPATTVKPKKTRRNSKSR